MIGTRRLKEIEARAEASPSGPWTDDGGDPRLVWRGTDSVAKAYRADSGVAAFIAASRQDVPDLCIEVRRLVKAMADISRHHRISAGPFYGRNALTAMFDRALDGYEVDDG